MGGAYVYIDPTPSKNVSASNIDVVPRNMGTIPAHGMHGVIACPRLPPALRGMGRWYERKPAHAGGGARACHPPAVPLPAPASSIQQPVRNPPTGGYYGITAPLLAYVISRNGPL